MKDKRRRGHGAAERQGGGREGNVFYVTAVPYCPQKMSLCPWEAALGGETHLSDRIYRDVLWPDPEKPARCPSTLRLPTNTPQPRLFPRKSNNMLELSATQWCVFWRVIILIAYFYALQKGTSAMTKYLTKVSHVHSLTTVTFQIIITRGPISLLY